MAKQFAVVGLGRFGTSVARTLYEMGYDVLGIDSDDDIIQDIADLVTHAVTADSTDENALKSIGIRNFDVVIVAIGNDVKNSILTTLILKELGVQYIVVKAQDELHGKVLEKIGADKVVYPERDMGYRVAHNLVSPNILDYIELAPDYSIYELQAPSKFIGKSLEQLDLRRRYGVNVMAIKHGKDINISPIATDLLHQGDVLVVVGKNEDLDELDENR
ncbi:trk system potassium uptake protein TrkA [Tumebacillus sp. BK434]|uniref:potassium channel family protein n=1 Tax=Tumebacillus sp. BK434 TaxID=2512169 RepID=UPI001046F318|nr:TrkA family potassium uptake protein [Tumebacillus sp. BK434]TCP53681.1 trk system potassium uptake protein TrkA [Tumebacillus sp. BK434]